MLQPRATGDEFAGVMDRAGLRQGRSLAKKQTTRQTIRTRSAKAGKATRWQRDPEGMRLRILEAATKEFAARGLAGARVDRIAAAAGAAWRKEGA